MNDQSPSNRNVGIWTQWSACSVSCGMGERERQQCKRENGRNICQSAFETCEDRKCLTDTSSHHPTSNRIVFTNNGPRRPTFSVIPGINISYGNRDSSNSQKRCQNWSNWSRCTKICQDERGPGKKSRSRICKVVKSGFSAYVKFKTEKDER